MANDTLGNGSGIHDVSMGAEAPGARGVPAGVSQVGVHDLVPKLGYREYWYPAVEARKVRAALVSVASFLRLRDTGPREDAGGGSGLLCRHGRQDRGVVGPLPAPRGSPLPRPL